MTVTTAGRVDVGFADRPPTTDFARLPTLLRRLTGDEKHQPSSYSTLDVLWVLYDRVLRVAPDRLDAVDRDRFLLSKGHGPAAYYAVLAAKGFVPESWLDDLAGPDSRLGHHPDRMLVPGVEIGSGSLGHGLGLGVGIALGLRAQGLAGPGTPHGYREPRVYVLLGDAELDEGSNHEAICYSGACRLAGLTAIVIDNQSATHSWAPASPNTGYTAAVPTYGLDSAPAESVGIATRFLVNGWTAAIVNGRDHDAIEAGLTRSDSRRPHVVVARVEGKQHA
ncbi:MAG TPA: transketolase [Micromonosporaceae bacterium]